MKIKREIIFFQIAIGYNNVGLYILYMLYQDINSPFIKWDRFWVRKNTNIFIRFKTEAKGA